jgi:hypothetical protein
MCLAVACVAESGKASYCSAASYGPLIGSFRPSRRDLPATCARAARRPLRGWRYSMPVPAGETSGSFCTQMRAEGFRPQPRHGSSAIADAANGFDDGPICNSPRVVILVPAEGAGLRLLFFLHPALPAEHAIGRFPRADRGSPTHDKSPNLWRMRADCRQHYAPAAAVFKAAPRFFRADRPCHFACLSNGRPIRTHCHCA